MSTGKLSKKGEVIQDRIKKRKQLLQKSATIGFKRPEGFPEGGEIKKTQKEE